MGVGVGGLVLLTLVLFSVAYIRLFENPGNGNDWIVLRLVGVKANRAAIGARGEQDADARFHKYLENRYGSLEDPVHREKAFEDFFNRNHIKTLQLIVQHSPPDQRQANIMATARWLAHYRQDMSAQEKADLANYFQSEAGQAALQGATAQFLSQDPEYRSATTPVINQLMTTLTGVKQ